MIDVTHIQATISDCIRKKYFNKNKKFTIYKIVCQLPNFLRGCHTHNILSVLQTHKIPLYVIIQLTLINYVKFL